MQEQGQQGPNSLIGIAPELSTTELMRQLTPPPEFAAARFDNYRPDPLFESQAAALDAAKQFVTGQRKLFNKAPAAPGIYLDGGFGVGKTHLLASIWHEFRGAKAFGSFLEYTSLVGYLGFQNAVALFSKYQLLCIDEFELDDPGDTMIMSRLLKELEKAGVRFAATSNTPPNALGQGRFAADDFKREIQGLGDRFLMISVDGEDYRHRDSDADSINLALADVTAWIATRSNPFQDDFSELLQHLGTLHPTKYRALAKNAGAVALTGLQQLDDQVPALRFVAFVDRLYEQQIPLRTTGEVAATRVFSQPMIDGGYRKKYLRALSRIGSLCELN